jgi:hypothetical protein
MTGGDWLAAGGRGTKTDLGNSCIFLPPIMIFNISHQSEFSRPGLASRRAGNTVTWGSTVARAAR